MLTLDLLGTGFHAVVVFGLGKDFLLKSVIGRCDLYTEIEVHFQNLVCRENLDF